MNIFELPSIKKLLDEDKKLRLPCLKDSEISYVIQTNNKFWEIAKDHQETEEILPNLEPREQLWLLRGLIHRQYNKNWQEAKASVIENIDGTESKDDIAQKMEEKYHRNNSYRGRDVQAGESRIPENLQEAIVGLLDSKYWDIQSASAVALKIMGGGDRTVERLENQYQRATSQVINRVREVVQTVNEVVPLTNPELQDLQDADIIQKTDSLDRILNQELRTQELTTGYPWLISRRAEEPKHVCKDSIAAISLIGGLRALDFLNRIYPSADDFSRDIWILGTMLDCSRSGGLDKFPADVRQAIRHTLRENSIVFRLDEKKQNIKNAHQ